MESMVGGLRWVSIGGGVTVRGATYIILRHIHNGRGFPTSATAVPNNKRQMSVIPFIHRPAASVKLD